MSEQMNAESDEALIVAIKITGGIGDLIVIARYLRDLLNSSEPFAFDIYYNNAEAANWIFQGVPGLRSVYTEFLFEHLKDEYSLAFWINQFVVFYGETTKWTALKAHKKLLRVLHEISKSRRNIEPLIRAHPYLDGYLAQKAIYTNYRRANYLHGLSKIPYGGDEFKLSISEIAVEQYKLQNKCYITIHNGFDPAFVVTKRFATKCYHNFGEVVQLLKEHDSELVIVQVGVKSSTPISGVDINLIEKTTIQETAGLIKHAKLHLDVEGGLVHIASCLGTRSCVLFGPTPAEYFGYPGNINFPPHECGGCWWINETWMDHCPRGLDVPKCMESHLPSVIASEIISALLEGRNGMVDVMHFNSNRLRSRGRRPSNAATPHEAEGKFMKSPQLK